MNERSNNQRRIEKRFCDITWKSYKAFNRGRSEKSKKFKISASPHVWAVKKKEEQRTRTQFGSQNVFFFICSFLVIIVIVMIITIIIVIVDCRRRMWLKADAFGQS